MPFRIATFNAGLAVGVLPYSTERVPYVLSALAALDLDLLFVQEFWLDSHWLALCDALKPKLPFHARAEPVGGAANRGGCQAAELAPLRRCAEEHCGGLRDEALARCVVRSCAPLALALPVRCLNCIASQPVGSLDEILGRCVGDRGQSMPEGDAESDGLIAYGGSFGTGLLARRPLENLQRLVFRSSVNARGALYTTIEVGSSGLVHLFATHLSPGGAEQEPQAIRLLEWIEALSAGGAAILLGDLNTTPGSNLFRRFEHAGFSEPDAADRRATFSQHGLGTGNVTSAGYRLDHILTRGLHASIRTQRVLDEVVLIESGGHTIRTTLSDHFGLLASIE
jgi:endonuclease/exonuclease/phosphatase family metal-dependent hydrolase